MKYIGLFDEKEDIVTKEKLETKQDKITGAATTITDDNLTASHALVSDANGKVAVSDVTSTELGYLDGVTSNVQTQLNKKLETVHDNDMLWGGKNLHSEVSPTDAAMVSVIGGNKFALCKPQGITIEYTNDGGATWVDYEATEKTKIDVISGISTVGMYYGKKTESSQIVTADDMLRITVNALNCGVYTSLRKILVEFATNGGTNNFVKIESATIGDQDTFTVVGTYNISGNTGWNSIPYSNNVGAYSLNQTSNIGVLRFTFSTGIASSYQGRPYVQNLILNGIINYVNPSKLSATGHLYSYDYQQNATFPANVTATKFIGDGSNLTNISYPVTSVNTKTGAVTLSASDVGAQPTITVNGIIKGDGAGNLSAQDTVAAELVDLPTVPTKVSELTNDANYITAAQAPVQSVNNKTGAVSLTASDVSAIPSTLTGTAGQVLTKTADGQEWKDVTSRDIFFGVEGFLQDQDVLLLDPDGFSDLTSQWNQLANAGHSPFTNIDIPMPCIDVLYNADSENTIVLRYAGLLENQAVFSGIYYDAVGALQYSVSLLYGLGGHGFSQYNIIPIRNIDPSTTTPLAPTEAGSVGTSTTYARGDHSHPSEVFWCTVTGDVMSENYSCDKTYAEIVAAYNAGKICIAKYGGLVFQLDNVKPAGLGTKYVKFKSSVASSSTSSGFVVLTVTSTNTVTMEDEIVSKLPNAIKITLTVAGWDNTAKTQSVTAIGVLADATKQEIRVMPVNAALDSPYIAAGVQCIAQAADSLTFGCETIPTEAIEVYVVIQYVDYSAS